MLIERLFNHLGEGPLFGLVLVVVTLPLAATGLALRRRGRRARLQWSLVEGARRPLKDLAPGRVATVGSWSDLGSGRGLLVDGEACAVVERPADAAPIPDGARVLVSGFVTRQEDDPRGAGYRGVSRVWRIDGAGDDLIVDVDVERDRRGLRSARFSTGLGAALLAVGVALAVATGTICWRAANDPADFYSSSPAE